MDLNTVLKKLFLINKFHAEYYTQTCQVVQSDINWGGLGCPRDLHKSSRKNVEYWGNGHKKLVCCMLVIGLPRA